MSFGKGLTHNHTIKTQNNPEVDSFLKHCGKCETEGNQHFVFIPQCFFYFPQIKVQFLSHIYFAVFEVLHFGQVCL